MLRHTARPEQRQEAQAALNSYASVSGADDKNRILSKFRLEGKQAFKWISNYTTTKVQVDSTVNEAVSGWMTWWQAADLWKIPESLPDRKELAEMRCKKISIKTS